MLNRHEIEELIKNNNLISGFINPEKQLTPNGFDITAQKIYEFDSPGELDFSNSERVIPGCREIIPVKKKDEDKYGWWDLKKGAYKILTNEEVHLPNNLIAIAFTRSSLLRMGAFTQNGVWDAGFSGKSEFILIVQNEYGIKVKQNARVLQLIFEEIKEVAQGYNGIHQNKK